MGSSFYLLALILSAKLLKNSLNNNKKLVGYRKVHAITSPTATHKSIGWHHKNAGAQRKDIIMSKQTYFLSAPQSSLGVGGTCGAGASQTEETRGPEREPAGLEKGCMALTAGEGEKDPISAQHFSTENCPGEEMEVKHVLVAHPRVCPH